MDLSVYGVPISSDPKLVESAYSFNLWVLSGHHPYLLALASWAKSGWLA